MKSNRGDSEIENAQLKFELESKKSDLVKLKEQIESLEE